MNLFEKIESGLGIEAFANCRYIGIWIAYNIPNRSAANHTFAMPLGIAIIPNRNNLINKSTLIGRIFPVYGNVMVGHVFHRNVNENM